MYLFHLPASVHVGVMCEVGVIRRRFVELFSRARRKVTGYNQHCPLETTSRCTHDMTDLHEDDILAVNLGRQLFNLTLHPLRHTETRSLARTGWAMLGRDGIKNPTSAEL